MTKRTNPDGKPTKNSTDKQHEKNINITAEEENNKGDKKSDKHSKKTENEALSAIEEEYKNKLEEFEKSSKEWQDKYIRLAAEFDNYRKRTLKEKAELILYANESLLKDILTVIDDFDRGIEIIDKSEDKEALKEGIHLIYNKFKEFLQQKGIKEIESKGLSFDVELHEAMTKIPAPTEEDKGKVIEVIGKGYKLNNKVIRYAKVVVGD